MNLYYQQQLKSALKTIHNKCELAQLTAVTTYILLALGVKLNISITLLYIL